MDLNQANLLLKQLKKGQEVPKKEDPEIIQFLEDLELVEVRKEKVILTQKGSLAAEMGLQEYINYNKTEKEILNFSREENRKMSRILILAFFLLFTLFLAAISTNLNFPGSF